MTSIVIAADDNYLPFVPCNFAQLARFGRRSDAVALLIPTTTGKQQRELIENAAGTYGIDLRLVPATELDNWYSSGVIHDYKYVSRHTYSKLLISDLLPNLDQVLYIDVDTLIRAPLDELLTWQLQHPLGAVSELNPGGIHLFGTPRQRYFNAGVLRMSLERMRQEQFGTRARELLTRHEFTLQDQDVFNLLFMDRFDCLPLTFNVFDNLTQTNKNLAALQDPAIVHFAGPRKPWHPTYKTPYAREWRRLYSQAASWSSPAASSINPQSGDSTDDRSVYSRSRRAGRGRLGSATRAVLPESMRESTRAAVTDVIDRALHRIEGMRSALLPAPAHLPSWGVPPRVTTASSVRPGAERIDLLISLPGSGTKTLGDALHHARPELHWLGALYGGGQRGLADGELSARFPWFASAAPDTLRTASPAQQFRTRSEFAAMMSSHALEITRVVIDNQPGRILVEVFPDQLHPSALAELLDVFRPRLVFMRRDILFPYLSHVQAIGRIPWQHSEVPDSQEALDEKTALHYAIRCDSWIDGVAELAKSLQLQSLWLTYDGVFTTGEDVNLLESFYPGAPLPVDPQSGVLRSTRESSASRSDASILGMVKTLSRFSAFAQARLLKLPGTQVGPANVEPQNGVVSEPTSRTRDEFIVKSPGSGSGLG